MDLWQGPLSRFLREADSGSLPGTLTGQFVQVHRALPSAGEVRSWDHSLSALAEALRPLNRSDVGVSITGEAGAVRETHDPHGVALEYHLPLSGKRIDVVLTGHSRTGCATAMVVELKQWSQVALEDDMATNVSVLGHEHVHPSQQALDYASWLSDYHSAFTSGPLHHAQPLSYCHEMVPPSDVSLRDPRFGRLLDQSPLFVRGEEVQLVEFAQSHVGGGDGLRLLNHLAGASFLPSGRVMDNLEAVLDSKEEWKLLDEQRLAFNAILDEVHRQQSRAGRSVILVQGAPGTGKTVVAVQLLAAALRKKWKAVHSTGGKAFTTALRSKFKGADNLFIWNMATRTAAPQGLDLLLVDEAHRIRETSDTRFTPKNDRGNKSQIAELVDAAKVSVFLLDENQFVRPDEVGSSALVREHAHSRRARFKAFSLSAQFRCGGCLEYVQWVDALLGFSQDVPQPWGGRYEAALVESPEALESIIPAARQAGESARLLAGFCWPWSDENPDHSLVPDVVIGDWKRPWNRKPGERSYKPADHPYTLWAETVEGEGQVGCIYSAQGFEFARAGVIWGPDLVWRSGQWVAQKSGSHDRPVKASRDMLRLVRNAYRVLLTRGARSVSVLVLDPETRAHVAARMQDMQGGVKAN